MHPVAEILELAAAAGPDDFALLAPGRDPLSYGALWNQTQAMRTHVRGLGITAEDRVAIVVPNGPEMAASFLGVACACAAAPLNPSYTPDDFRFYLADLSAKAMVVSEASPAAAKEAARELGVTLLTLRSLPEAGAFTLLPEADAVANAGVAEAELPAAEATALLLHTSGTTSRPKLVPLSAANLAASARNIATTLGLTPADRCLNIMPLFHIHGIAAALLATLASRGSVVCTNGLYGQHFFAWLAEFHPTWYTAVPTMHQAILARGRELGDAAKVARLRFVRSSSAPLPPVVLEGIEAVFGAPMIEAYGMTEASHQMASNPLPPGRRKPGSVGVAAGPEVAVMDESGALLPAGETGEVVIRGENVTVGYLGNPAANQSAFTGGWFRTGDQGRFDEDGYLHLTGRLKELINRGGEKISPREIDEVLLSHPQVQQALAFSIPHVQLGEEIGAAVELHPDAGAVDPEALRRFVAGRLPHFKVPRILRIVPSIPKGPTGKLQRIGLAKQLGIEAIDDLRLGEFVEPRAGIEQRIAALWRGLLPEARCGRADRFEALGGDSLLAATMLAALADAEGVEVPFEAFVTEGTIAALAAAIEERQPMPGDLFQLLRNSEGQEFLFCFPGHDGVLLGLSRMAQHLNDGLNVYGLDLLRCDPKNTLEQDAALCSTEIRRRVPDGPIRLAGVCVGGCLAYAVAERLVAEGRRVDFLALIDTINPAWAPAQPLRRRLGAQSRQWLHKLRHHGAHLRRIGPVEGARYLGGRLAALFQNNSETLAARLSLPGAAVAYRRAMLDYRPKPTAVFGLVLRFAGRRLDAPALGWRPLLKKGCEVVDLPMQPGGSLAGDSALRVASVLNGHLPRTVPGVSVAAEAGIGPAERLAARLNAPAID